MKNLRNALLVVMMSLCSVLSYASWYDRDEITIPASYINSPSQSYLLEKAVTIFGEEYDVEFSNVKLSQYWFYCDIAIFKPKEQYDVTQTCSNEYPQDNTNDPAITSTLTTEMTPYWFIVHSRVRLYGDGEGKTVQIIYHFTKQVPASGNYTQDDYYLVLNFPYTEELIITGVEDIDTENLPIEYFDLQGRKLNGPQPGIVIEKQGNKTTKKIYK